MSMPPKRAAEQHIPEADPELVKQARALAAQAPCPARIGKIACGTAGWTDPTLLRAGTFYPAAVKTPAQRLAHYAEHFPMVEVDATFYAIPAPQVAAQWVERSPAAFIFDIKAHPVLTGHPIDRARLPAELAHAARDINPDKKRLYPKDLPGEVREALTHSFRAFLEPLQRAGRLGCVMLQLPPWTTATRGAVKQLEQVPSLLPGVRVAVEFRHPSWLQEHRRERVFDMLRGNGLAYVAVDEPDVVGGGVPAVLRASRDDLAVVRFHGHNVAGWHRGASVLERFNYLYAPEQLRAWVEPVRRLSGEASELHAVFNNCVRDYAVLGAKALAALLVVQPAMVPEQRGS
jgi:uncharacterized protein YecE (DUF72 family)